MTRYKIRFIIRCDYGSFQHEFGIDPAAWESEKADHNEIIWGAARHAVARCFSPEFQGIYHAHPMKPEMEFDAVVEPDYTSWRDSENIKNQPASLKIFWGKKRTFVVKTVLYPESIKPKGDS